MVAHIAIVDAASKTVSAPAGWTSIQSASTTTVSHIVTGATFYKIAGAGEASTYTFTFGAMTISYGVTGEIHRFNATDPTTPINVSAIATVLTSDLTPDPVSPSVTTTVANCLVLAFLAHDHNNITNSHTPPASHTERTDFASGEGGVGWVGTMKATMAERVFASAAATGTATHNCSETIGTDGVMTRIAIAPGSLTIAT